ncbi:hypothetical protein ARMSODRAFT_438125 [Armillaria solidipes]|uniref:Uncharacterized protein n=1 Tax=Armillaria solidipes TaxID=1076256 RepID=A0A2H3B8N1_9AGAR|nr:hypothetical protein ARMSODRAFT_438125 [Armillaria solidipes]
MLRSAQKRIRFFRRCKRGASKIPLYTCRSFVAFAQLCSQLSDTTVTSGVRGYESRNDYQGCIVISTESYCGLLLVCFKHTQNWYHCHYGGFRPFSRLIEVCKLLRVFERPHIGWTSSMLYISKYCAQQCRYYQAFRVLVNS